MDQMNQNNESGARGGRQQSGPLIQDEDSINFVDLLDNLLQYRWYFVATVIVFGAIAVGYAMTATPIYTANSLIQINERQSSISSLEAFQGMGAGLENSSGVAEEIEIMRSRSVMSRVVQDLKLNVVVQVDNRMPYLGDWLSRMLPKDENGLVIPPVDFVDYAWGGEKLVIERVSVPNALLGQPLVIEVGESRQWTIFDESSGQPIVSGTGAGSLVTSDGGDFQIVLAALETRPATSFSFVVVPPVSRVGSVSGPLGAEPVRGTNLVRLTFSHPSPFEAARILNTITQVYFTQNLEKRSEEAKKTLDFLKAELPKLREDLEAAELALNNFRASPRTIDVPSEVGQIVALSASIETQLLELALKRRELLLRYDASYPAILAIDDQRKGLEEQRVVLAEKISKLPKLEQAFVKLTLDVEVNKELYGSLLNSQQQLEIAKAGTVGNVAIIDPAIVPRAPSQPNKNRIVAIGLAIGLLLGFALTQLLALIAKVVRDPKKLELETGLPTLSIIPMDGEQMSRAASGDRSVFMLAKETPDGAGVEALRSLRTALLFALSEKPRSKVILITSAVPSQGKSFISANLSYLLGAMNKRTLLIDADIRKSSLRRYFDFDLKEIGLSSVLRGQVAAESVIIKDAYENLDFLPSGPRMRNPGDLLAGEQIQAVINGLAEKYDFVVVDSPPLLPVHDARALGMAADVSLFVARQDAVSLTEVQDAIDVFNKSGSQFDGVVFNCFVPSRVRYSYGYGYGGKYGRYGRYGKYATYGKYGKYGKYYDSSAAVDDEAKK